MPLETLPPDCKTEDILAVLERDGGCIVADLLAPEDLDRVAAETEPWIERSQAGFDDFSGRLTKRTGALIARCPSTRDVVMDPRILPAARAFLAPYCQRIQLHLTQTIDILPGESAQALHRDRLVWAGHLPPELEPQFNTIWALSDFTAENGATHLIPGSQSWQSDREPKREETVQAEMSRGSVLLYSGSVIHGGGANRSAAPRIGMNITYALGWLRQEENQFLSCPPKIARDLDPELTDLLGYTMGSYALGYFSAPEMIEGQVDTLPPEVVLGRMPRDIPGSFDFPGSGRETSTRSD